MDQDQIKIADIITTEYADFLSYCALSGKTFISELTNIDYVAFRTSTGRSREYIKKIRNIIENPAAIALNVSNNSVSFGSQGKPETETELNTSSPLLITEELESSTLINEEDIYQAESMVPSPTVTADNESDTVLERKKQVNSVAVDVPETSSSRKVTNGGATSTQKITIEPGIPLDSECSLAHLFGVEASDFSEISIGQLSLSVRSSNCLKKAKYTTLENILNKTVTELKAIKNMGVKSIKEIVQKVKDFVYDPINIDYVSKIKLNLLLPSNEITNEPIDGELKFAVESLLLGEEYKTDGLTDVQLKRFDKFKEAVSVIGEEICLAAYLSPEYNLKICNMLLEFASPFIRYESAMNIVINRMKDLADFIKERRAIPFIKVYEAKEDKNLQYLLSECNENTTIAKIPYICRTFQKKLKIAKELNTFILWLDFDINKLILSISQKIQSILSLRIERSLEIFSLRAEGKTLEEIGALYGITRERVRQIEGKINKNFWSVYSEQRYDLILLVYAMRDGDTVLYFKEIKEILGDFADILWSCIKHSPKQQFYFYSKTLDAVVIRLYESTGFDEADLISKINEALATLPELIEKEKKADILSALSSENDVPLEVLESEFEKIYKLHGVVYYRGYLTVVTMCNYVLKHRFPAGFKIADTFEADRFRHYMVEFFGEKGTSITDRALDAKIGEIGILCNRGKYIHPDYIQVDRSIIDAINDYVENSSRSLITYGEIYEAMKDVFEETQITNRYLLQGALKKYGCRFHTCRDFIRKIQSVTYVDELESFVEERGIVHKTEIFAEFTSIGEAGLARVVARSTNVFSIDDGYYIHASQFNILPEDYEHLRAYLRAACKDIPVNIRSVHETVALQFPDFMYRNDFEDRNKLFAALNYMFRGEFRFSRPYIAKLGVNDISNRSVILQHIEEYDSIEIEELIDICEDNNIRYLASSILIQMLAPDYIRINRTTLMKKEYTGITDDIVTKAVEFVLGMLESNDYVVASKVNDFLWLPQIEVEWNAFLLESIIIQSKKVNIVNLIGDPLKHSNAVYVSDKFQNDTFDSLLLKIITDEVRKGSFTSKTEMREWLKEEGFIEGKLPNFLESTKYFYVNETGVHCTGE